MYSYSKIKNYMDIVNFIYSYYLCSIVTFIIDKLYLQ